MKIIVTDIVQKGKSETYKIYSDNKFICFLQAETIIKNNIKKQLQIDEEEYKLIREEDNKLTCFSVALAYVSKCLKSKRQVYDYLKKKEYNNECINLSIERLKDYGYIDDLVYARSYYDSYNAVKGNLLLKKELKQKGISEQIIDEILQNDVNQEQNCKKIAKKWLKNKSLPLDVKEKQKLMRHLLQKGYPYDIIKNVLQNIIEDGFLDYTEE